MPEEHAKISPSSFNYRNICNWWDSREGTSDAAEEGTLLHAALESDSDELLNLEQQQLVTRIREFLAGMEDGASVVAKEQKLTIDGLTHHTWGTADRVIVHDKLAYLVDFKFGRLAVPHPKDNLQMQAYALGVFDKFPYVDKVVAVIIAPRRSTDEFMQHNFTREQVPALRDMVDRIMINVNSGDRNLGSQCQYCSRLANCEAVKQQAVTLFTANGTNVVPASKPPARMTADEIGVVGLPLARVMEEWAAQVKARAKELLESGVPVPGHKLGRRSAPAKFTANANDIYAAVSDILDVDEFLPACNVSLTELKKAVRKTATRGEKDAVEQAVMENLKPLMAPTGEVTYITRS